MCLASDCKREPGRNFCKLHYYRMDQNARTAVAFIAANARDEEISPHEAYCAFCEVAAEFFPVDGPAEFPEVRAYTCPCGTRCYSVESRGLGRLTLELKAGGGYVVVGGYAQTPFDPPPPGYAEFAFHDCDGAGGIESCVAADKQPVPSRFTHYPVGSTSV